MIIQKVWWRRITSNDLYNIEKPLPPGPKGQLHIDIPNVPELLRFFSYAGPLDPELWPQFEISARCLRDPSVSSKLTFRPRPKNTRYDIPQQNINAEGSERHPAWTSAFGWPPIHGLLNSTEDAASVLLESDLRVVIFLDTDEQYYADFVLGQTLPTDWPIELQGIFVDKPAGSLELSPDLQTDAVEVESSVGSRKVSGTTNQADSEKTKTRITSPRGIRYPANQEKNTPKTQLGRQGYGLSASEKKAVEQRAVVEAISYFESEGFTDIRDVGDQASYDLSMIKNGQIYFVEVKGTTGAGSVVLLTRNEVEVHQKYFPHNALVVVSSITLTRGEEPLATGGEIRVILPWEVSTTLLSPIAYEYRLP